MSGRRRPTAALSDRQRLFVSEYLIDLNIAAAARRAGYASATAHAPDKLITPAVEQAIEDAIAARTRRIAVDADRVVAELAKLAFSNMADFFTVGDDGLPRFDLKRLAREDAAAIQSLTVDYWRPPIVRKRDRKEGEGPEMRRTDVPSTPRRVRIQLADKRAALIDLARHLGMEGRRQEGEDAAAPLPEGWKVEKDIYAGRAKYVRIITGVPRPGDPTGQRGYMKRVSGPPEVLPDDVLYPEEVENDG